MGRSPEPCPSGAGANIAFTGAGTAQISTASGQSLALLPGTNVGIGTTSPTTLLHVVISDTTSNGTTALTRLTHNTSGTPAAGIGATLQFGAQATGATDINAAEIGGILTDVTSGTTNKGAFIVRTSNNGTLSEQMRVDNLGNVGIGTTTPATPLNVYGTVQAMGGAQFLALPTPAQPTVTVQGAQGSTTWGLRLLPRARSANTPRRSAHSKEQPRLVTRPSARRTTMRLAGRKFPAPSTTTSFGPRLARAGRPRRPATSARRPERPLMTPGSRQRRPTCRPRWTSR